MFNMKYIVYLTTNKVNNKIYIGIHGTRNPYVFDGYLGCGVNVKLPKTYMKGETAFKQAVKKYGINNFYRNVLHIFDSVEEAKSMESLLVNEDFIKRTDTYNMILGGGMPPDLSKKVFQFDLQGNLLKEWRNQVDVTAFYNCYSDMVLNCTKFKRSFLDTYWSHEDTIDISEYKLSKNKCVYQYNTDGILLNIFNNIAQVSEKLDIDKNRIVNSIALRSSINNCYFLTSATSIDDVLKYRENKSGGRKKVYRYTLDGKFDKEYKSLADGAKDCGLKKTNCISQAIKKFSTSGGYKWSFLKTPLFTEVSINQEIVAQKVAVYDLNNVFIKDFDSVSECQKEYPYCRRVLRNERKKAHNCIFKYIS